MKCGKILSWNVWFIENRTLSITCKTECAVLRITTHTHFQACAIVRYAFNVEIRGSKRIDNNIDIIWKLEGPSGGHFWVKIAFPSLSISNESKWRAFCKKTSWIDFILVSSKAFSYQKIICNDFRVILFIMSSSRWRYTEIWPMMDSKELVQNLKKYFSICKRSHKIYSRWNFICCDIEVLTIMDVVELD